MTRGKIIFIDGKGNYYQTPEFNGDMYPEGHGGTIIEKKEEFNQHILQLLYRGGIRKIEKIKLGGRKVTVVR